MRTNSLLLGYHAGVLPDLIISNFLTGWPRHPRVDRAVPYNLEITGPGSYRITLAVPGFDAQDLSVEAAGGTLTVTGRRVLPGKRPQSFRQRFRLPELAEVQGAELRHGLLHIDITRQVRQAMAPRRIPVGRGNPERLCDRLKRWGRDAIRKLRP